MSIPILTVGEMREWEKDSWAAGRNESDVIDKVGRAIARRLTHRVVLPGERVLFVAGKGHNGDDVRAAHKYFQAGPYSVLLNVSEPASGLEQFLKATESRVHWIVDGLFGIGLDRPLDAEWQKLIQAINESGVPVVAIDVPSGLNVELGEPAGAAIAADLTLTVGAPKTGLLTAPEYVGRLEVLQDIGLIPCTRETELNWTTESDFAGLPFRRRAESNKGTYGHLAIVAGSFGYHGAAVLAGKGALRAQPGLVTIYPQELAFIPVASQCQAAMVHLWRAGGELPKGCSAILFGPGLAAVDLPDAVKTEFRRHWRKTSLPMVADASALDWLEAGPTPYGAIRVITPHPGEAGRMLGRPTALIQEDRLQSLRDLSKKWGNCYVVLKGHQTLVGNATGKVFVNSSGNPYLAQGGSGDLLGGYIAGLLAQPAWQKDPLTTIRYAVWEHGHAADGLLQIRNWTVEDLSVQLGRGGRHLPGRGPKESELL